MKWENQTTQRSNRPSICFKLVGTLDVQLVMWPPHISSVCVWQATLWRENQWHSRKKNRCWKREQGADFKAAKYCKMIDSWHSVKVICPIKNKWVKNNELNDAVKVQCAFNACRLLMTSECIIINTKITAVPRENITYNIT